MANTVGLSSALLFLLLVGISGVEPLKNVVIIVPPAVSLGENVKLQCLYDLDHNESLYTVKWYLDNEEFFRYVPKEIPPIQTFPMPGMTVDKDQSDNHKVTLRSVRHDQSGKYRCEVSADAPYFDTDVVSAHMTVVEFPEKNPLIEVAKYRYEVGDRVRANCSFGPSRPPANITWYINDVQVKSSYVNQLPVFDDGIGGVWVKYSLEVDAEMSSFRGGRLKLKCLASVFSRFTRSAEAQIEEEKPRVGASKDSSGKQVISGLTTSQGSGKSGSVTQSLSSSSSRWQGASTPAMCLSMGFLATVFFHYLPTFSSPSWSILTQAQAMSRR